MKPLMNTDMPNLLYRGKVRDSYDLGDKLLIVATDRISAFDFVLPNGIPYKGDVLNQLSAFWFEKTAEVVPNHCIKVIYDVNDLNGIIKNPHEYLAGRSMIVKKAKLIEIECIVRGYLAGSAFSEYRATGIVNGIPLVKGLKESSPLVEPMFTPTTKAVTGHDQPLLIKDMVNMIGSSLSKELIEKSVDIYLYAHQYARNLGIIIADTKMEFGVVDGKVILIDELLTPDSSRFWDASNYMPGQSQPSYDKQPVRDWLTSSGWDKNSPPPSLPKEVIDKTSQMYQHAFKILTGKEITKEERWK